VAAVARGGAARDVSLPRWGADRAARVREPAGAGAADAGDARARVDPPLVPRGRPRRDARGPARRGRAGARGDGDPLPGVPVGGGVRPRPGRAADRARADAGRSGGPAAVRLVPRTVERRRLRSVPAPVEPVWLWGMTRYQWVVFLAAWLGWGFDVFDGLLFNFVAPVCVPRLLGVPPGDPRVTATTGAITSLVLVGWGTGGILFGFLTDRLGRSRTLLLTMLTYAGATAACALAPGVWLLAGFRLVAALGIGGEWAAGASLVAEVVPESRRVAMGALLYTSAPLGILLAGMANDLFTRRITVIAAQPDLAWRLVFLTGLVPAA